MMSLFKEKMTITYLYKNLFSRIKEFKTIYLYICSITCN